MKTSSLAATLLAASPAFAAQTYVVARPLRRVRGTIRIDPSRPEASSVEFAVQATSIDTANAERDAHLRSANWNKALDEGGVILGDEVQVSITLEATQQKEAAGE